MDAVTYQMIERAVSSDKSMRPGEQRRILGLIRSCDQQRQAPPPQAPEILRRTEVAKRFKVSVRCVDKWAKEGLLRKIRLPGRQRAMGFHAEEVDRLVRGEGCDA